MEKPDKTPTLLRIKTEIWNTVFFLYLLKCLVGTIFCYALYKAIPQYHLYWSIISLLLVLAPDWNNSIQLPLNRIKANLTGGIVGLLCFFIPFPQLISLCIGVLATILVCSFLNYSQATRSALAALVIVFIQEFESAKWSIALERIFSVILGCLVALALTLIFRVFEEKAAS
ncbi:putative membrane protein [Sphaerochaeta pleomorpha str. Grapes]|uniref:Putative membrane protein n=1 Tax=Sphaerochaeta pleomorpha (strain ATCC BAA-1885 / DSM 22778 / Grapes) TaxID=158190 RepID=G8QT27_SPHPG|nr:FUSC family protein [Sphaerochaeta pleomorpha]AEV27932.1 putative membrane protein [Sphaerochaeta pleomorpha str. Grapes]